MISYDSDVVALAQAHTESENIFWNRFTALSFEERKRERQALLDEFIALRLHEEDREITAYSIDTPWLRLLAEDKEAVRVAKERIPSWFDALRVSMLRERQEALQAAEGNDLTDNDLIMRTNRLRSYLTNDVLLDDEDKDDTHHLFEYLFNLEHHAEDSEHRLDYLADYNQLLRLASRIGTLSRTKYYATHGADVNWADEHAKTPLWWAANQGHLEVAKYLLEEKNAIINWQDAESVTPLLAAVQTRQIPIIEYLLERGADANAQDMAGWSPVKMAASLGDNFLIELLIKYKGEVNSRGGMGKTPLSWAAMNGHLETARLLVEKGAIINRGDNDGSTALIRAVAKQDLAMARYLLENKATPNCADNSGWTPLKIALNNNDEAMVNLLIDHGVEVNVTDAKGRTPIMWAVRNRDKSLIDKFIEHGGDINAGQQGRSALMQAVEINDVEMIPFLLDKGASTEGLDKEGNTPLMRSVRTKELALIVTLLLHGANINTNESGITPLIYAITENDPILFNLLLENDANVNAVDAHGNSPLNLAVFLGRTEMRDALLKKGADPNIENQEGWTAFMRAVARNDKDEVGLMLKHGAVINGFSKSFSKTPLSWAVLSGFVDMVQFLLENGANPDARDGYGKTALMWATAEGNKTLVDLLLKSGADVNATDGAGGTALTWAVSNDDAELTVILLDHGAHLEGASIEGENILAWLVANNRDMLLNLLLIRAEDAFNGENQETPLMQAAAQGNLVVARYFLARGMSIDAVDKFGQTALMFAAKNGQLEIVNFFLENTSSNLNVQDSQGMTAMMHAIQNGSDQIVKTLHQAGSSIRIKNKQGMTAVAVAVTCEAVSILQYLIKYAPYHDCLELMHFAGRQKSEKILAVIYSRIIQYQKALPLWKAIWYKTLQPLVKKGKCAFWIDVRQVTHAQHQLMANLEQAILASLNETQVTTVSALQDHWGWPKPVVMSHKENIESWGMNHNQSKWFDLLYSEVSRSDYRVVSPAARQKLVNIAKKMPTAFE